VLFGPGMQTNHPLILQSLRRTRRAFVTAAVVSVPFGIFCLLGPLWSSEGRNLTIAVMVLGAISLATGVFASVMTARYWSPERSPLMDVLRDRATEIVWIYEQHIDSQAAGITVARTCNVQLQLVDGKGYALSVKPRDRDQMMEILAALAPRATFGYSRELARQYKRDPRSLAAAVQ
jgi:hypothetical protein